MSDDAPKPKVPGLPGVNEPVPEGGKGIVASPGYLGRANLTRAVESFERSPRDASELASYNEAREAWLTQAAADLGRSYGPCGPMELAILRGASRKMFWSEVMFDRAERFYASEDGKDPRFGPLPKVVETASRLADSYRADIQAANALRALRAQREASSGPVDPLASFREALPVSPDEPNPSDEKKGQEP